ncbi:MAG: hypothetical protein ACK5XN_15115 [Bacteroidota bacterium]
MSDELSDVFSGFMPMIDNINITPEVSMINTEGELLTAHTFSIIVRDGTEYVFSISNNDLMKLCFLITKVINN